MNALLRLRGRISSQRGVIALLTLVFMIFLGMTMLVLLWGIARVTGAFNTLYAANQSAAYAALSSTKVSEAGPVRVRIDCDGSLRSADPGVEPATICERSGSGTVPPALVAADSVMRATLGAGQNRFGLCYDGNPSGGPCPAETEVRLVAEYSGGASWSPSFKAFNMPQRVSTYSCINGSGEVEIPEGKDVRATSSQIACWGLREYGQIYNPNFETGVITRAQARVDYFPGCLNANLCPRAEIRVAASASQDRPIPDRYYYSP
jgi:hypothetical protein